MKAYKVNEIANFIQPGEGNPYVKLGVGKIADVFNKHYGIGWGFIPKVEEDN